MAGQPILPSRTDDPTGVDALERRAIRDFSRRLDSVRNLYVTALAGIAVRRVVVNATTYQYETTPTALAFALDDVGRQVDRLLLQGGLDDLWFNTLYIEPASEVGAGQQFTNLSVQSAQYAATRQNLTTLLTSQPYQTRMGFLKARVADSLTGYAATVKSKMSQVLQDGLALGKGAREIARNLTKQIGVEKSRAELIARTEVPGALRAARLAEADQATQELGTKSKELHFSALSPTTRPDHRARHGKLYTTQEQRLWQNTPPHMYNCKCSSITVLLDADGNPLTPGVIARAQRLLELNPAPSQ